MHMRRGVPSLSALREMQDEMNRVLKHLESSRSKQEELWQWIEKLPEFEGQEKAPNYD
jgi:hypothetical protein